jgi:thiol-disulfide isomerase/thioredoxin
MNRLLATLILSTLMLGAQGAPLGPGDTPYDQLGTNLQGQPVLLSSMQGKAVVLSFWASWCAYCIKELPILESIQRKVSRDRLQVIGVNTEDHDTFRAVSRHMKNFEMMVTNDEEQEAYKAFGANGLPHLVIIGRDGKIMQVFRGYGEGSLKEIVASVNRAIGATSPASPQP